MTICCIFLRIRKIICGEDSQPCEKENIWNGWRASWGVSSSTWKEENLIFFYSVNDDIRHRNKVSVMISICIQPSLLCSECNASGVMCNSRRLPRQPGCPALSKPSTVNESFCTGEQRTQNLSGDIHVLGSIWDLKEVRSWKFRQNRKEHLGSLLRALSWEARQACQRGEASSEAGTVWTSQNAAPGTK